MENNYSINYNLSPDSLTGSICAIEGIREAIALVNGPTGCRMMNAYFVYSQDRYVDYAADTSLLSDDFFLRQFRVPSTYLDEFDFIFSSEDKLLKILKRINSNDFYRLLGLVNTSGTALIGDDLEKIIKKSGFSKDHIIIETTGYTDNMYIGFQETVINMLEKVLNKKNKVKKLKNSVNLIGFSLSRHNWFNDLEEIKGLLNDLGVEVNTVLCAGTGLDSVKEATAASLNIVISEEYGNRIAQYLKDEYGIPYVGPSEGLISPYGLSFTEVFVEKLGEYFNIDRKKYIEKRDRAKRRIFRVMQNIAGTRSTLKGLRVGIFADSSIVNPLTRFLYEYMGLYPVLAGLRGIGTGNLKGLKNYISDRGLSTRVLDMYDQFDLKTAIEDRATDIILGSSLERNLYRSSGKDFSFINISLPEDYRAIITPRPLMGINGVLTLIEDIMNSVKIRNFNYRY